jgi:hypothetical protein
MLFSTSAMAARPFATDDAGTVSQGFFEIETGCNFWKNLVVPELSLKHGLTDRMDLGIGFGYTCIPNREKGFNGGELGLKFAVVPELVSLSAGGMFGDATFCFNCILSKGFGKFTFDANLGLEAVAGIDDADMTFGLCCHFDGERFGAGLEVCGTHRSFDLWQIGCNCAIMNWLAVDAGFSGDFQSAISPSINAGLTFSFPIESTDK